MAAAGARAPLGVWGVFTAPLVLFLVAFLGFPAAVNLVYAVSEVSFETLRSPEFTGLANLRAVLSDPDFWGAASFSLRFGAVTAILECGLGLFLAVFLAPLLRRRPWLLALLLMPLMVAPALVGLMYRLVLHEFAGPVPHYLWAWFGTSVSFFRPGTVFWTLVVVETLQWTPFAFLLFHVAYGAIPADVREAAALDAPRPWQRLRHVELPLMLPTLVVALLIRFVDGVRVFDNVYVLVGAGPGGATRSLSIYVYEAFFKDGAIGPAVAASVVMFAAFLAGLVALNAAAMRRERR